jgi:hypothetical protein
MGRMRSPLALTGAVTIAGLLALAGCGKKTTSDVQERDKFCAQVKIVQNQLLGDVTDPVTAAAIVKVWQDLSPLVPHPIEVSWRTMTSVFVEAAKADYTKPDQENKVRLMVLGANKAGGDIQLYLQDTCKVPFSVPTTAKTGSSTSVASTGTGTTGTTVTVTGTTTATTVPKTTTTAPQG